MNFISLFADTIKPWKLRGTGTFHPQESGRIDAHLSCIRQKDVNIWFYEKGESVIAIDSGYHTNDSFFHDLETLGIDNQEIEAVFVTHGDVDHMGGLLSSPRFAENAGVYLHQDEEEMILGEEIRFQTPFFPVKNPVFYDDEYELFEDMDVFRVKDIIIECFHCPGHTRGHSVFLVDKKYLFTGDSIAVNQHGGHCFFDFYNMDTEENINSLEDLKETLSEAPPELVCTGHNGICNFEGAFSNIHQVAKASRRKPFDPRAPFDVFKDKKQKSL